MISHSIAPVFDFIQSFFIFFKFFEKEKVFVFSDKLVYNEAEIYKKGWTDLWRY